MEHRKSGEEAPGAKKKTNKKITPRSVVVGWGFEKIAPSKLRAREKMLNPNDSPPYTVVGRLIDTRPETGTAIQARPFPR